MGKVTKIEIQKKRKNRYSIYIDNKFCVGLSERDLLELGIRKDQEIDKKDLKNIKDRSDESKVKERAIRLLSIRPQSIEEIKKKLKIKGYDDTLIKRTVSYLKREGYLNDKKFTKAWIYNRKNFNSMGKRRLFMELKVKKVSEDIVKKELNKISENTEIKEAYIIAERRIKIYKENNKHKIKEKISSFLLRRGYGWDVINKVLVKLKF